MRSRHSQPSRRRRGPRSTPSAFGTVYARLGLPEQAEGLYRRALAIQEAELPEDAEDLRSTRQAYAELLRRDGRDDEAGRPEDLSKPQ